MIIGIAFVLIGCMIIIMTISCIFEWIGTYRDTSYIKSLEKRSGLDLSEYY